MNSCSSQVPGLVTLNMEVLSSSLGLLLEPKPALREKAGADDSTKSGWKITEERTQFVPEQNAKADESANDTEAPLRLTLFRSS